jgi:putative membrane protein
MLAPALISPDSLHLGEAVPPFLAMVAYLTMYGIRAQTLARERRPVPRWRIVSFVFGVLLMFAVQVGPADTLADSVLVAHMVQHIIIGDFASLFIVFGLTGPVIQPLLHMRPTRPLRRLATPIVALILWAVDLYAWHV